jgi:hypothetical protein
MTAPTAAQLKTALQTASTSVSFYGTENDVNKMREVLADSVNRVTEEMRIAGTLSGLDAATVPTTAAKNALVALVQKDPDNVHWGAIAAALVANP